MKGKEQNLDRQNLSQEKGKDMMKKLEIEKVKGYEKMKSFLSAKTVAVVLVFIALVLTAYFYREGIVSFLPLGKKDKKVVELTYQGKEYNLSYKDKPLSTIVDIAHFEEDENWQEEGVFDFATFFEGESSILLNSRDNEKVQTSLDKKLDLSDTFSIKLFVFVKDDPGDIQELNLVFANEDLSQRYQYPIRALRSKWNMFILPREQFILTGSDLSEKTSSPSGEKETFGWKNIEKVVLELTSRPKARSTVYFDFLWGEKDMTFLEDWNVTSTSALTLGQNNSSLNLLFVNYGSAVATLSKIGSASDFTFQAKFTPVKKGPFGLFLRGDYSNGYGYYFTFDGIGKNSWSISKYGVFDNKKKSLPLLSGEIKNFAMDKNKDYWLKAELKKDKITAYFSQDGSNFTKIGEVSDGEYKSGGVGLSVSGNGMVLADEFYFSQ